MCGIFGAVGDDVTRDDVAAMGASLAHRGPDDDGLQAWAPDGVVFGHTRLAIFDLTAAGRNPLANEDGTVWVTFNGVIYNARELRADLEARGHVFRSRTDTEVLVHAYEEWADDHVTRVRGMFAYALYDRRRPGRRGRVLVVRDRLGIKPLYYYAVGGRFVFASELGAIRSFPRIDSSADYSAIADYLTYRYIPAPKTPARHIRELPPATCLVLDADDSIRLRRYWTLAVSPRDELRTAETAFDALRSTLESAVARHLAGDVDVGILLSGGIDSSGIPPSPPSSSPNRWRASPSASTNRAKMTSRLPAPWRAFSGPSITKAPRQSGAWRTRCR